MNFLIELAEPVTQTATAEAPGGLASFIPLLSLLAMFGILYFLMIRPQRKRQRERVQLLNALKVGDRVVTIGGLHGTILEINDELVVLKVNDVTKLTFSRSAVENRRESQATTK